MPFCWWTRRNFGCNLYLQIKSQFVVQDDQKYKEFSISANCMNDIMKWTEVNYECHDW